MSVSRGSMKSSKSSARILKVILLGDGGVGKSSLMNVFVHGRFNAQSFHTIGVEFLIKVDRSLLALG